MAKIRKQIAREERERALRLKQQIRRSGEEDDEGEDLKGTEHSKSARYK